MFEKALHGGNIAAAFAVVATTADMTFTGGAASAITAALSGFAIFKKADPSTKALAKEMAALMDHELAQASLTDDRRRIVTQMLGQYQPSNDDIVQNDMDAGSIADSLCERIKETATDPAHQTKTALQDFRTVVIATLEPVLSRPEVMKELMPALGKELLLRTKQSGQGERLRDEGITEKAIIRLAQRYAINTDDLGRAWLELQNAMDVAVRVQQEGRTTSNHGDFVDVVIKRVAELAADGAYGDASAEIDAALEDEDAAHAARKVRLLESGIEIARLDNDPERVAALLVAKLQMNVAPDGLFGDLRALRDTWYERGRDGGLNFEASVAIHLAQTNVEIATGDGQKGAALNDLGVALSTLGERESSTERLEQAVTAYTAVLQVWTRDTVPLDWAMAQNNLGNALSILGEFESGTDRLEQAVAAYTAALQVRTRDTVPLDWAMTQENVALVDLALFEKTRQARYLDHAMQSARLAQEVYLEAGAGFYIDKVAKLIAKIDARRGGLPG